MNNNFYTKHQKTLLAQFDQKRPSFERVLGRTFSAAEARDILALTRANFLFLLPRLPYIGGKQNILTENLVVSTWFLSLYKVLKTRDLTDDQIGDLTYQIAEDFVNRQPRWVGKVQAWLAGSGLFKRLFRKLSAQSQKRTYPADFVVQYVEGNGRDFDYGFDFTECAIHKLFKAENAGNFAKHMCRIDYLTTSFNGIELIRSGTIANGATRCDFRFRRLTTPKDSAQAA